MNVASVRKMTKMPRRDELLNLPEQRISQLCPFCDWRLEDVTVAEGRSRFRSHRQHTHGRRKWPA